MFRQIMFAAALAVLATACAASSSQAPRLEAEHQARLKAAIASPSRTPANVLRDQYRHPEETLSFFGVRPTDTVVEIAPGGGWYTEILAPYVLGGGGTFFAAANGNGLNGVRNLKTRSPALGAIRLAAFPAGRPQASEAAVPDGSADVVLTFRNVHNWMMGDEPFAEEAFRQMYAMLRPGGTLGVVEHRLPENADTTRERSSGYLKTSTVRRLAEGAGFRFVASSEVNANPADTTDHPRGVWTLPPTLRLGDEDRERYLAIGESDRMTLRFVKPE